LPLLVAATTQMTAGEWWRVWKDAMAHEPAGQHNIRKEFFVAV